METRKTILAATERLARSKGLARLTTREIALEAGVAEGSIFNHFGSKDDLVLAVVVECAPAFRVTMPQAGAAALGENLTQVALQVFEFYRAALPTLLVLFGDAELLQRRRESLRSRDSAAPGPLEAISCYIAAEQSLGRIGAAVRPLTIASMLVGACLRWIFDEQVAGEAASAELSPQQFARELATSLCRGLEPSPDGVCE